jgi:hypothetical protein
MFVQLMDKREASLSQSETSPFPQSVFFQKLINPDFSHVDFKKRSLSKSNLRDSFELA